MRTLCTAALAATLNVMAFATAAAAEDRELLTIAVVIVNDANVPKDTMDAAQALVAGIYARIDIDIVWKDSKAPLPTVETNAALQLAVIIIPESRWRHRERIMAFAINRGNLAYLFYKRVEDFSRGRSIPPATVLGHTMAHELGHLLLPNRPHASSGIMRQHWDREPELTILRTSKTGLGFTPEEARSIRGGIPTR